MSNNIYETNVAGFIAPEFWTALSEEVHGLRETLENSEDEMEAPGIRHLDDQEASNIPSTGAILFQHAVCEDIMPKVTLLPETRKVLLEMYQTRVDNVYKILHWPTVLSQIDGSHNMNHGICLKRSLELLETTIYFMAICSITNDEARTLGLGERLELLQVYRSTVEGLLARSALLQNPSIIDLQAFVIYLVRSTFSERLHLGQLLITF
jgi:hypothetical protein